MDSELVALSIEGEMAGKKTKNTGGKDTRQSRPAQYPSVDTYTWM